MRKPTPAPGLSSKDTVICPPRTRWRCQPALGHRELGGCRGGAFQGMLGPASLDGCQGEQGLGRSCLLLAAWEEVSRSWHRPEHPLQSDSPPEDLLGREAERIHFLLDKLELFSMTEAEEAKDSEMGRTDYRNSKQDTRRM